MRDARAALSCWWRNWRVLAASTPYPRGPHPTWEDGHAHDCWLQWVVGLAGTSLLIRHFFLSTASLWTWGSPSSQPVRPAGSSSLWCFVIWAPSSQCLDLHLGCLSTSEWAKSGIVHPQTRLGRWSLLSGAWGKSDHSPLWPVLYLDAALQWDRSGFASYQFYLTF